MSLNLGLEFEYNFDHNLLLVWDDGMFGEEEVAGMLQEHIGTDLEFDILYDISTARYVVFKFKEPGSLELIKLQLGGNTVVPPAT